MKQRYSIDFSTHCHSWIMFLNGCMATNMWRHWWDESHAFSNGAWYGGNGNIIIKLSQCTFRLSHVLLWMMIAFFNGSWFCKESEPAEKSKNEKTRYLTWATVALKNANVYEKPLFVFDELSCVVLCCQVNELRKNEKKKKAHANECPFANRARTHGRARKSVL